MFLNQLEINPASKAREIVELDYRTAAIFDQFGIRYCCGLQRPLDEVCATMGISTGVVLAALQAAIRPVPISSQTAFETWNVDFLIDYIINVHHHYLGHALPEMTTSLEDFLQEHQNRFPAFHELNAVFRQFRQTHSTHQQQQEENIFPYLLQVAHAYKDKDPSSFAPLLIKTLRKPLAGFMEQEHTLVKESLMRFRSLTHNYTPVAGACSAHKVLLAKLRELDSDLIQHLYLENEILLPKVIRMEQELLQRNH